MALTRERLEIAIVATELDGLMKRIRKYKTPQLRALLREVQQRNGALVDVGYGEQRHLIQEHARLFAVRPDDDAPVTPEPGPEPLPVRTMARAKQDFT